LRPERAVANAGDANFQNGNAGVCVQLLERYRSRAVLDKEIAGLTLCVFSWMRS